jgi:hypothetical protein
MDGSGMMDSSMGCGDGGACTMSFTGSITATIPCTAKVEMVMTNTDALQIGGNNGMVGAYTFCERFHPISPGSLNGGCFTQVSTYFPDGGVDQTFKQTNNEGRLLCVSPLDGFLNVTLANDAGMVMLSTSF